MTDIEGDPGDDLEVGDDEFDDFEIKRRPWLVVVWIVAMVAVVGAGIGVWLSSSGSTHSTAASGPEGVPIQQVPDLAPASTTAGGSPVDGITCRTTMQQAVGYHIHVHLSVFVNGHQERIPAGAGIAAPRDDQQLATGLFVDNSVGGCLYWLHVHANDGIIHVESPTQTVFTLGQFFDVWGQPLGPDQVATAQGPVVAFVNGKRFAGSPRDIPLVSQDAVQLDVGNPVVAFEPITFKVEGLCGGASLNCANTGT